MTFEDEQFIPSQSPLWKSPRPVHRAAKPLQITTVVFLGLALLTFIGQLILAVMFASTDVFSRLYDTKCIYTAGGCGDENRFAPKGPGVVFLQVAPVVLCLVLILLGVLVLVFRRGSKWGWLGILAVFTAALLLLAMWLMIPVWDTHPTPTYTYGPSN